MKPRLLLLLVTLFTATLSHAYDFEVDGIYYNINGESVTVTHGDNSYSGDILIPKSVSYNGTNYSVTKIGSSAFNGCSGLTEVTIPNSVTTIGSGAFCECSGLTEVTIPNSVTHIGDLAFFGCSGLTSVTIGNSVTRIGSSAFLGCNLSRVKITDLVAWCNIEFNGESSNPLSRARYLFLNDSEIENLVIPDGISKIKQYTFYGCKSLTSVTIPNSVTSIGNEAFYGCTNLTSVTIPNSVTSIGESAFNGCSRLTSVTIPESVTSIGESTFYSCSSLTEVTIPNSVTSIGDNAFFDCSGLTSVTIGNSVTSIGNYAFQFCRGLTSVTIPNSVTRIGNYAFQYCRGLTEVTIPNSVTKIGEYVFSNCSGLTSVTIGNSVTSIGVNVFGGCSSLTSFYGKYASEDNRCVIMDGKLMCFAPAGLISYNIPISVTSIGNNAFQDCTGLTEVTIPNSVTEIGESAFYGCSSLKSVTISNSVKDIRNNAFRKCSKLKDVTIPLSVNSIGSYAFEGCNLSSVTVMKSNPENITMGTDVFKKAINILYVPKGSREPYAEYSQWEEFLRIEDSINRAASECPNQPYIIGNLEQGSWNNGIEMTKEGSIFKVTGVKLVAEPGQTYAFFSFKLSPFFDSAEDRYGATSQNLLVREQADIAYFPAKINAWRTYSWAVVPDTYDIIADFSNMTITISKTHNGNEGEDTESENTPKQLYLMGSLEQGSWKTNVGVQMTKDGDKFTASNVKLVADPGQTYAYFSFVTALGTTGSTSEWDDIINRSDRYGATTKDEIIQDSAPMKLFNAGGNASSAYSWAVLPNTYTITADFSTMSVTVYRSDSESEDDDDIDNGQTFSSNNSDGKTIYYKKLSSSEVGVTFKGNSYDSYKNEYSGHIEIPSYINYSGDRYKVVAICEDAFSFCDELTSVTIPNSVTSIEYFAFSGCNNLSKFSGKFASSDNRMLVANGEIRAFAPGGLTSYTVPNTVTSIGPGGFNACSKLVSVTLPKTVTTIGINAFGDCSSLSSISIPNSVTSIGDLAFFGCRSLTSIEIPDAVTTIGRMAFYGCSKLSSVTIGKFVTSIRDEAFDGCSNLSSVTIKVVNPNSIYVGQDVFTNYRICTLYVPRGTLELYTMVSPWSNFRNIKEFDAEDESSSCPERMYLIGNLEQGSWKTNIGVQMTKDGDKFTASNVKLVADPGQTYAYFSFVTALGTTGSTSEWNDIINRSDRYGATTKDEIIQDRAPMCVYYAGVNASAAYSWAVMPSTYTITADFSTMTVSILKTEEFEEDKDLEIGDYFSKVNDEGTTIHYVLTSLKEVAVTYMNLDNDEYYDESGYSGAVNIPAKVEYAGRTYSVTSIDEYAFYECEMLTSVFMPNSITSIGDRCFYSCSNLTTVVLSESITEIPYDCFSECHNLMRINIPYGVVELGEWCFNGCNSLTDIEIPNTVTSINYNTFSDCYGLKSLTIPNSVSFIGGWAFYGCSGLESIIVDNDDPSNIVLGYDVFGDVPKSTCELYVPDGCKELYSLADQWKDFMIIKDFGEFESGVEDVYDDNQAGSNAPYYDLMGRRVENPAPGIYIQNGKKVLVK